MSQKSSPEGVPPAPLPATDPGELLAGPVDAVTFPQVAAIFEAEPPDALLWWAIRRFRPTFRFGGRSADLVIIDLIAAIDRRTPVILEGEGKSEKALHVLSERYGIEWGPRGSARLPVRRAADRDLFAEVASRREQEGLAVWVESGTEGPKLELDARSGRLICRPLAGWDAARVRAYLTERGLPEDPSS